MKHTQNTETSQEQATRVDSEMSFSGSANNSNDVMVALSPDEIKKMRSLRTSLGIKWTAAGALLGFFSCICSICNPIDSLYYVNLYGVSSLAVCVAFYGLYLIFE